MLYDARGRFLIGRKLDKGYFFYNPQTGGRLVPRGQELKGAGKWALPGGKLESSESVTDGARREFFEETAARIGRDLSADEHRFNGYTAVYFKMDGADLDEIAGRIIGTNLPAGLQAGDGVKDGSITSYPQIALQFPNSPRDNELQLAEVWNVNDPHDWSTIQSWNGDPVIGWYYEILRYLKDNILSLSSV